jgi:hypothetical protein
MDISDIIATPVNVGVGDIRTANGSNKVPVVGLRYEM